MWQQKGGHNLGEDRRLEKAKKKGKVSQSHTSGTCSEVSSLLLRVLRMRISSVGPFMFAPTYQVGAVRERITLTEASYGRPPCLLNLAKLFLLVQLRATATAMSGAGLQL